MSDRLAQALVARGIAKGDRVGIAMRNCPAWIVGYMAALKAGAIATLLNGWWQADELDHALAPDRAGADHRRRAARPPHRRDRLQRSPIVSLADRPAVEQALAPLLDASVRRRVAAGNRARR